MATHNGIPGETLAALRAAYTPGEATVVFAGWQSVSGQGDARVIALLDAYEALRAIVEEREGIAEALAERGGEDAHG